MKKMIARKIQMQDRNVQPVPNKTRDDTVLNSIRRAERRLGHVRKLPKQTDER